MGVFGEIASRVSSLLDVFLAVVWAVVDESEFMGAETGIRATLSVSLGATFALSISSALDTC